MHYAAMSKAPHAAQALEVLLDLGLSPQEAGPQDLTPLDLAMRVCRTQSVQVLVGKGALQGVSADKATELLHLAVAQGLLEVVPELVRAGAGVVGSDECDAGEGEVERGDGQGNGAADGAATGSAGVPNGGAPSDNSNLSGCSFSPSLMMMLAEEASCGGGAAAAEALKHLAAAGATPKPCLLYHSASPDLIQAAVDLGVDVNIRMTRVGGVDLKGCASPLLHACWQQQGQEVVSALVALGADVHARTSAHADSASVVPSEAPNGGAASGSGSDGTRASNPGATGGSPAVRSSRAAPAGCTALHLAMARGLQVEVASVLLKAGADPNARDALGRTPLYYALAAPPLMCNLAAGTDTGADARDSSASGENRAPAGAGDGTSTSQSQQDKAGTQDSTSTSNGESAGGMAASSACVHAALRHERARLAAVLLLLQHGADPLQLAATAADVAGAGGSATAMDAVAVFELSGSRGDLLARLAAPRPTASMAPAGAGDTSRSAAEGAATAATAGTTASLDQDEVTLAAVVQTTLLTLQRAVDGARGVQGLAGIGQQGPVDEARLAGEAGGQEEEADGDDEAAVAADTTGTGSSAGPGPATAVPSAPLTGPLALLTSYASQ